MSTLFAITGKPRDQCIQALQLARGDADLACTLLLEGVDLNQIPASGDAGFADYGDEDGKLSFGEYGKEDADSNDDAERDEDEDELEQVFEQAN